MSKNQKIYKKYIGRIQELEKLKSWLILYNYTIRLMITSPNNEEKINNNLIKLKVNYMYQKNKELFVTLDIDYLNKIFIDFIQQYTLFIGSKYENFSDLENDKLIILNIVEEYFSYIRIESKNRFSRQFYKQTIYRLSSSILPKSKKRKMLSKYMQNISYYAVFAVIFSVTTLIISFIYILLLTNNLHYLNKLPPQVIKTIMSINNPEQFIAGVIIYFSFLFGLATSIFVLIKTDKFLKYSILPEKMIAFERDELEKQSFISITSVIISIISLMVSITLFLK